MSCWKILGIKPTDDKKQIKLAFAKKVKENPPDKDARVYQEIREAYNMALRESVYFQSEEEDEDEDWKEEESQQEENAVEDEEGDEESDYSDSEEDEDDVEDEDEKLFADSATQANSFKMYEIERLRQNMHFENARSIADIAGYINVERWYFNQESDEPALYHILFILKLVLFVPGIIIAIIKMALSAVS